MLEVKEKCTTVVTTAMAMIDSALAHYMKLFKQSFEVLTTLQEDPNIKRLETKAC